jgi:hypothetical protein
VSVISSTAAGSTHVRSYSHSTTAAPTNVGDISMAVSSSPPMPSRPPSSVALSVYELESPDAVSESLAVRTTRIQVEDSPVWHARLLGEARNSPIAEEPMTAPAAAESRVLHTARPQTSVRGAGWTPAYSSVATSGVPASSPTSAGSLTERPSTSAGLASRSLPPRPMGDTTLATLRANRALLAANPVVSPSSSSSGSASSSARPSINLGSRGALPDETPRTQVRRVLAAIMAPGASMNLQAGRAATQAAPVPLPVSRPSVISAAGRAPQFAGAPSMVVNPQEETPRTQVRRVLATILSPEAQSQASEEDQQ